MSIESNMSRSGGSDQPLAGTRYIMVDKLSGQEVGVLTLAEGQGVPQLDEVELQKAVDGQDMVGRQDDVCAVKTRDENGNDVAASNVVARLVTILVDHLDGDSRWSRNKKNNLNVKLRELLLQETLNNDHCLKLLKLFDTLKFGINKPFKAGWLRKVNVRSIDNKVTSVCYVTPPDSEGGRLRLVLKKEIAEYLDRVGNKDLSVENFVTTRTVIGLSAPFEEIRYDKRLVLKDFVTMKGKKVPSTDQSGTFVSTVDLHNDKDSSYDTIADSSTDDDSDSSDSEDSCSDGSVSDDKTSDCSDAIVPVIDTRVDQKFAEYQDCPDLSQNVADETVESTASSLFNPSIT